MIKCAICNIEFLNVISHTHLKKHNISIKKYREIYGPTQTEEYTIRRSISISNAKKGKVPPNKGKPMPDKQKILLSDLAKKRYKDGFIHPLKGKHHSIQTKQILKEKSKSHAGTEMAKLRSKKSMETKILRGYDHGLSMRGKEHTEITKNKISQKNILLWKKRKSIFEEKLLKNISKTDCILINSINDEILQFRCKNCGFEINRKKQIIIDSKLRIDLCPKCRPPVKHSSSEIEIAEYIKTITDKTILLGNRFEIYPLELDIYIPDLKLAFEYCGLYYHSELLGKFKTYHLDKLKCANKANIKLITIFEDEWLLKKDIVKNKINTIINRSSQVLYARNCKVKIITNKLANQFLNKYHLQGTGRANISIGLYKDDELLSVMTFSKTNISRQQYEWEINRYSTKFDITVVGGASKLFKFFVKEINPKIVITYSDLRWSIGHVYSKIGFVREKDTPPNYWYINGQKRIHRYTLRKCKHDEKLLTEWENRKSQGWNRIWDCGNAKYKWVNPHH
jgi:predicted Zn-ribbon and HTH transcriptional regulator